jgi:hypothetical protein
MQWTTFEVSNMQEEFMCEPMKFMLFLLIFGKLFDLYNAFLSEKNTHAMSTETQGGNVLCSFTGSWAVFMKQ